MVPDLVHVAMSIGQNLMKGWLEVAAFAESWTPEIVPSEDMTHSAIPYSDLSGVMWKIMLLPVMRYGLQILGSEGVEKILLRIPDGSDADDDGLFI